MDKAKAGYYLLSNRCARQAFALGKGPAEKLFYERKAMIEELLAKLCVCFMMRLLTWVLMDNHYHLLAFFNPRWIKRLSNEQLVEVVFQLDVKSPSRAYWDEKKCKRWKAQLLADKRRLKQWRKSLCDPSKFMAYFNEAIARRCNEQDGTKGHFWEGRFHSITLEDPASVIRAACYVSLNPVRA
ncbi:MAG: hypothetical protein LR015_02290, partial [Verrucomicrobia bacterium]|nr:hypothetical protein [Verrucomicrobiota bacterium]